MPNHHVVLRKRIEITTPKHCDHRLIQRTVTKLTEQYIVPLLEELFSKHIPNDRVIHIHKLVVDVGKLTIHELKNKLPNQIKKNLTKLLQKQLNSMPHTSSTGQVMPLPEAQLQAITYYLSEGHFTWWITEKSTKEIENTYLALLYHTPIYIEKLWFHLKKKEKAVQRFVTSFVSTTVEKTLSLLLKQPIQNFLENLRTIERLLYKTNILTNQSYTPQQQLYITTLLGLLNQTSPTINQISFIQMVLQQVAHTTSLNYETILTRLQAYHRQYPVPSTIQLWLNQLHDIAILSPLYKKQHNNTNQEHFLKTLNEIADMPMSQLETCILQIKTKITQAHERQLLKNWLQNPIHRERLIKKLPHTLFITLLQSIDPTIATIVAKRLAIYTMPTAAVNLIYKIKEMALYHCTTTTLSAKAYLTMSEDHLPLHPLTSYNIQRNLNTQDKWTPITDRLTSLLPYIILQKNRLPNNHPYPPSSPNTFLIQPQTPQHIQKLWNETIDGLFAYLSTTLQAHASDPNWFTNKKTEQIEQYLFTLFRQATDSHKQPLTSYLTQMFFLEQLYGFTDNPIITPHKPWHIPKIFQLFVAKRLALLYQTQPIKMVYRSHPLPIKQPVTIHAPNVEHKPHGSSPKRKNPWNEAIDFLHRLPQGNETMDNLYLWKTLQAPATNPTRNWFTKERIEQTAQYLFTLFRQATGSHKQLLTSYQIFFLEQLYGSADNPIIPPHRPWHIPKAFQLSIAKRLALYQTQPIKMLHRSHPLPIEQPITLPAQNVEHKPHRSVQKRQNPWREVIDFLLHHRLPKAHPTNLITKLLTTVKPRQIRQHLIHLCQDQTILQRWVAHMDEEALPKLLATWLPAHKESVHQLIAIINSTKGSSKQPIHSHVMKSALMQAAIAYKQPVSIQTYLERLLCYYAFHSSYDPILLCRQWIADAIKHSYHPLAEMLTVIKHKIVPLQLSKVTENDLTLLPQILSNPQTTILFYYPTLAVTMKTMVSKYASSISMDPSIIPQLVIQHLPTLPEPLQKAAITLLSNCIKNHLQKQSKDTTHRWQLFLRTGILTPPYKHASALLEEVLKNVTQWPQQLLMQTAVHERLTIHFTHTQLLKLFERYHPLSSKKHLPYLQNLYTALCTAQTTLGHPYQIKQLFWKTVWGTLPLMAVSIEKWMDQMLTQLSQVLAIPPMLLLHTLQWIPQSSTTLRFTTLLKQLQNTYQQKLQAAAKQNKEPILEQLYLLIYGELTFFTAQHNVTQLETALTQLMADKPAAVSNMLRAQKDKQLVSRRIAYYLNQKTTAQIIALLAEAHKPFVMTYFHLCCNLPQPIAQLYATTWPKELAISILVHLLTTPTIEEGPFIQHTLHTVCFAPTSVQTILTAIQTSSTYDPMENKIIHLLQTILVDKNQTASHTTHPIHPLTLTTKEQKTTNKKVHPKDTITNENRLYIHNSGLVFVWPFLYDFLANQKLLIHKQFSCKQAAHHAVYFLHYLATGIIEAPEWQLTLPKLLCGLPYDEVLLPYSSIDNDKNTTNAILEKLEEETQLLIQHAIQRWEKLTENKKPINGTMTPDLFRTHCLNRLGILREPTTTDTIASPPWQLTLIYQEEDHAILPPPWPMTKIMLPWMQEEIILFWICSSS